MDSASPISTPAWTSIRFSGACWRANWRRCGSARTARGVLGGRGGRGHRPAGRAGAGFRRQRSSARSTRRCVTLPSNSRRRAAAAARRKRWPRIFPAGRAIGRRELPPEIPAGCILSNELLDALPVHRVVVGTARCRKCTSPCGDGHSSRNWGRSTPRSNRSTSREQGITLREGQQAEAGLEACRWIAEAGTRLGRGFVLTVDYGREAAELYDERHMRGTLLAYSRHRATEDFLRAPGEQDLTAHVNFTALDLWGRRSGLTRSGLRPPDGISCRSWPRQRIC